METLNVSTLLQWSEAQRVSTVRGMRNLRTAAPDGMFWAMWRSSKAALQAAGVSPRKNRDGDWEVCWWEAVADDSASDNAQNSSAPAQESSVPRFDAANVSAQRKQTERVSSQGQTRKQFIWSVEQEAIFAECRDGKGNFVVFARAGTGKTTTIKHAFSFVPASFQTILYAVFNKKNQLEAKEVITDPRVDVRTWNSLGFMFVLEVWPNVKPDDEVERERVEKAVGVDTAQEIKSAVYKLVGFAKNTTVDPTLSEVVEIAEERDIDAGAFEEEQSGGWTREKLAKAALRVLELSLERDAEGRISFNDQVWLPVRKGWVHALFDFVVVDECQDMNAVQLLMAKKVVREGGRLGIVGDDRQAIYNFRGADTEGMFRMQRELKMRELKLTVTRRCPKRVVELAKAIVPDYQAAPEAPEGIIETVVEPALVELCKAGDAVLSRTNAPLMSLCLALLRRGTPARIEGRDIGKALVAVVRKLKAKSVPHFMGKLETWASKQKKRFEGTKRFEAKCEEINDTYATLQAVAEGAASVAEIEVRLGRLFQDSTDKSAGPAVVLSSVHKAKGLEWEKVFLLRKTFNRKRPATAAQPTPAEVREEQNIYYVALTRAKLHLVFAEEVRGVGRG